MLSSRERLQERQGQYAAPRHEYLQQLVDEFQRSPDILRKEEVVANLANFAYDPINFASLGRLRIMDLFLDILDADQEQQQDAQDDNAERRSQQGPATSTANRSPRKHQLVEFAFGGICNCIADPQLQQQFIDGDGVDIVAPYVLRIPPPEASRAPESAAEMNISVWALTVAYFLLDSAAFADVTPERFMTQMKILEGHPVVLIANTAAAFLRRFQELLAGGEVNMLIDWDEDSMQTLLELLKYLLLGTNVVLFVTAALVFFTSSVAERSASGPSQFKRALLVTAHPDDESMFFLPLVHSLQQPNDGNADVWQTHLLCLSRGNFDGLGETREKELKACATYLGLSSDRVQVLEDPKLQDGMQTQWDEAHIAAIVDEYITKHNIDAVFTFDVYGVSGHANHVATHHGVKIALQQHQERCSAAATADDSTDSKDKIVRGWALESTSLLRKYVGVLDTALSYWFSGREEGRDERQFVFVFRPRWNYNAMALHRSQFVWYRRLFVVFSRYTFINTFQPLLPSADISASQKKTQ